MASSHVSNVSRDSQGLSTTLADAAKHGRKALNPLVVLKAQTDCMTVDVASYRQKHDPWVLRTDLMDAKDINGQRCKSFGASPQDQCLLPLHVGFHRGKYNHTHIPALKTLGAHEQVHPHEAGVLAAASRKSNLESEGGTQLFHGLLCA